MQIGINRWTMPSDWDLGHCFKAAKTAGFDTVEINLAEDGTVYRGMDISDAHGILRLAREHGVHLSSLSTGLGWKYPLSSPDPGIRAEGMAVIREMIQVAKWLELDTILNVPAMVTSDVAYDIAYQRSLEALKECAGFAEEHEVHIGIENVWNKFLLSPMEFAGYLDEIGSNWVGAYFDIGNVLLYGYPEHWIKILGKRICKVHAKDFRTGIGNGSGFCNIWQGDVNWPRVREALDAIGYKGPVTAEVEGYRNSPDLGLKHIADSLRSIFV